MSHQRPDTIPASEAALASVLEGNPAATFVIDLDHRITHWNRACEAITGLSAEDVLGCPVPSEAFYDGQTRPLMANLVLEQDVAGIEHFYAGKLVEPGRLGPGAFGAKDSLVLNGRPRWMRFVASPIRDAEGRTIGSMETLQDVSAMVAAQQALGERTAQLEQMNATLARKTSALKELMDTIETRRAQLGDVLVQNLERVILPRLHQLRQGLTDHQAVVAAGIEHSLREIASPFVAHLASEFYSLSPQELRICTHIRGGMTTKEIAALECISAETVKTYRQRIRRKLALAGTSTNLTTFLERYAQDGAANHTGPAAPARTRTAVSADREALS